MITETAEWIALRRVHEGRIIKHDGHYFRSGKLVGYLADALDELIDRGLLALGRPDPLGRQQVCVTHTGQRRYVVLCAGNGDEPVEEGRR